MGVGTRYTIVRKALGMQQETAGTYTVFEPGQRIVEQVSAGPASYTVETRFTDLGGQTRVDVETHLELGGLMGRLGEKMAARPVKKQAADDHARIKQILERG